MNTNQSGRIAVIGGDIRALAAAGQLMREGWEVRLYGFGAALGGGSASGSDSAREREEHPAVDALCCSGGARPLDRTGAGIDRERLAGNVRGWPAVLEGCTAVLLPLPASSDGIHIAMPLAGAEGQIRTDTLLDAMKKAGVGLVCAGKPEKAFAESARELGIEAFDYYAQEEFAVANAVPTAEGALAIAMNEMPVTLDRSAALVIGYGRIGKALSRRLKALGAFVTATARRESDLAWIRADGLDAARTGELKSWLAGHRPAVIFNTVPHPVLGRAELALLGPSVLLIDLASRPGGVDIAAAGALGHRVIWALSLPGKAAPVTAGQIIADTVLPVLAHWNFHSAGGD